ncbi:uncharacterized protein TM35_000351030, partial [Trypanosoma theileri]
MFVRLRGVVYLLVLLHCCACVVRATGGGGAVAVASNDGTVDVRSPHDEVLLAENRTAEWLNKADDLYVEGDGCRFLWEEELKLCKELVDSTERKTKEVSDYVTKTKGKGSSTALNETVKGKVKELLQGVKETVLKTTSAVKDVRRIKDICTNTLGSMENALTTFNTTREFFMVERHKETNQTYWTPEKVKLAEDSNRTFFRLSGVWEKLGAVVGKNKVLLLWDVDRRMKPARKKTEGLKTVFEREDGVDKEIKTIIDEVGKTIDEAVGIRTQKVMVRKDESTVDSKIENAKKEARQRMEEAIREEERKLAEDEQARKDEAARQEREKREKREEEKRLAMEQEKMARQEQANDKKAEETEKKKAKEEADKRKADEKIAQEEKAKQDRERKDAEEKAREA